MHPLLIPIIAFCGCLVVHSARATDKQGCKAVHSPVCGSDGLVYMNACFARAAGTSDIVPGVCDFSSGTFIAAAAAAASTAAGEVSAAAAAHAATPEEWGKITVAAASVAKSFARSRSTRQWVSKETMQRYAHEGMVLVGVMEADPRFRPSHKQLPANHKALSSQRVDYITAAAGFAAVSVNDGFIYKPRQLLQLVSAAREAAAATTGATGATAASSASAEGSTSPIFTVSSFDPAAQGSEWAAAANEGGRAMLPDDIDDGASRIPRRKVMTVFGADDRAEITGPQSFPWTAAGRILFSVGGGSFGCSGGMVGPQAVLTAAHCILGNKNGTIASTWRFAANHVRSGPDARFGVANAKTVYYNTNYWSQTWWMWDIAVVLVDSPRLGLKTGTIGMKWDPNGYAGGLVTAGYPADKPLGSFWYISADKCKVADMDGTDAVMYHQCDTKGGQSGSLMWQMTSNADGTKQRYIRAVLNAETPSTNQAVAINQYWFNFIESVRSKAP